MSHLKSYEWPYKIPKIMVLMHKAWSYTRKWQLYFEINRICSRFKDRTDKVDAPCQQSLGFFSHQFLSRNC